MISQSADCTKVLRLFACEMIDVPSATEHPLLAKTIANGTTYVHKKTIKQTVF